MPPSSSEPNDVRNTRLVETNALLKAQLDVVRLAQGLQKASGHLDVDLQDFHSGAVWLDIRYDGRLFTLAYQPTARVFGVDEADDDVHGLGTHFEFCFGEFAAAKAKLLSLLEEAGARPTV